MPPAKKKSSAPSNSAIHIVTGSDEMAVKSKARELAMELAPSEGGEFALEPIDACADNANHALTILGEATVSLSTPGFLTPEKLVWLKNVNFASDTQLGGSKTVLEALDKFQQFLSTGLPTGTQLLISIINPDKRRSFYKSLSKLGALSLHDKPTQGFRFDEDEASRSAATSAARERKLRFAPDALDRFAAYVGYDARQVANELDKIDTYLSDERRDISVEDVRLLVPETRKGIIFDLGNCIARRNLRTAMDCLQKLFRQGEDAISLLYASIMPTIQRLTAAAVLIEEYGLRVPDYPNAFQAALDRLPPEAQEIVPRKKDGTFSAYAFYHSAQECRHFTAHELADATISCADATVAIMSTGSNPGLILEQLIVKILTKTKVA